MKYHDSDINKRALLFYGLAFLVLIPSLLLLFGYVIFYNFLFPFKFEYLSGNPVALLIFVLNGILVLLSLYHAQIYFSLIKSIDVGLGEVKFNKYFGGSYVVSKADLLPYKTRRIKTKNLSYRLSNAILFLTDTFEYLYIIKTKKHRFVMRENLKGSFDLELISLRTLSLNSELVSKTTDSSSFKKQSVLDLGK